MSSAEFFVKFAELSWTECRFSWPWHRVRCRANMLAFYLTAHIAWWSSWWLGHLSGAALKAMDTDCPRVVSEANDLNKIRGFSEVCPKPVVLVDEWKTGWFSKATSFMWETNVHAKPNRRDSIEAQMSDLAKTVHAECTIDATRHSMLNSKKRLVSHGQPDGQKHAALYQAHRCHQLI